jgi:hypothetical protein
MFVEKAKIFDLVGGNIAFLDSIAVMMASCIDKFESIKTITDGHSPFENNLYWTDGQKESSALPGTSLKAFSDSFVEFAEKMIVKVYELKVDVRKMRFTDVTDYDRMYKRATAYVYEFFGQYSDTVRASLSAFTTHTAADADAILKHVLSTEVLGSDVFEHLGFKNMRAATLASNESATPVYELNDPNDPNSGYKFANGVDDADGYEQSVDSDNDPIFYHRNTHLANMNIQELRTLRRVVQHLSEHWNVASITLADKMAKFAASDLASSTMGLSNATSKFSDMLGSISKMQAVGEAFVGKLEEWIDIARDEDGNPTYTTDSLKTAIDEYTRYFDGKRSTVSGTLTNVTGDLVHSIYDTASSFISVPWATTAGETDADDNVVGDEQIGTWQPGTHGQPDAKFD